MLLFWLVFLCRVTVAVELFQKHIHGCGKHYCGEQPLISLFPPFPLFHFFFSSFLASSDFCLIWGLKEGSLLIITIFLLYVFSYMKRMLLHTVYIPFWVSLRALLKKKCFILYILLQPWYFWLNHKFHVYWNLSLLYKNNWVLMKRLYKSRKKWRKVKVIKYVWYLLIYNIWPLEGDRQTLTQYWGLCCLWILVQ